MSLLYVTIVCHYCIYIEHPTSPAIPHGSLLDPPEPAVAFQARSDKDQRRCVRDRRSTHCGRCRPSSPQRLGLPAPTLVAAAQTYPPLLVVIRLMPFTSA